MLNNSCRVISKCVTEPILAAEHLFKKALHSQEMSQKWRAVGDAGYDLTSLEIEPQTCHTDSNIAVTTATVLQCITPMSKTLQVNCKVFGATGVRIELDLTTS